MPISTTERLRGLLDSGHCLSIGYRWDYEIDHVLTWSDERKHHCEAPPRALSENGPLKTICGLDVTTNNVELVELGSDSDPTCPQCIAEMKQADSDVDRRPSRFKHLAGGAAIAGLFLVCAFALNQEDHADYENIPTLYENSVPNIDYPDM